MAGGALYDFVNPLGTPHFARLSNSILEIFIESNKKYPHPQIEKTCQ
jgi:hypothetical protein